MRRSMVAVARAAWRPPPRKAFHGGVQALAVKPFLLADIGEGIAEVELLQWFVKAGDEVGEFDPICEVQSDKATVEITSRFAGRVAEVHHHQGAIVPVGDALIDIDVEGAPEPAIEHGMPVAAPGRAEVEGRNAAEAPVAGEAPRAKAHATPAVRRIARERGLDLAEIRGSGPGGRILKGDVLAAPAAEGPGIAAMQGAATSPPVGGATAWPSAALADLTPADRLAGSTGPAASVIGTTEPLRGLQRLMIKSMTASLSVPHFAYQDEVIMDEVVRLRQDLQDGFLAKGVRLSYLPFLLKACSLAMLDFPLLNASFDADAGSVTYEVDHNLGVAMDTPRGLVVPCIKAVQSKSLLDISQELHRLQLAAAENRLTEADLSGTTLTLSNIGSIGGTYAQPVVVPPMVAIGALGRMQRLPRFGGEHGDEVVAVRIMNVSWSGDHRVVDGATMARFSNAFKGFVEQPATMLAQLR